MKLPKLYKLDNTGSIREWSVEVLYNPPRYIITHGQQGGVQQEKINRVLKGKNIGRSNETTPYEQAILDAQSYWQKQLDRKGYSLDSNPSKPITPMLAHKYEERRVRWPAQIQCKWDGIRCIAYIKNSQCSLVSRQNKQFKVLQHIENDLLKQTQGPIILDGELYSDTLSFQQIISAVKRDEPNELTPQIQYHIYDCISSSAFSDRSQFLLDNIIETQSIRLVLTYNINSHEEMLKYHEMFVNNGYEGSIIRNNAPYECKRSYNLLKYKDFIDEEFEITGAEQDEKMPGQCTFRLQTKEGYSFRAKPKGTTWEREQYWQEVLKGNLIGEWATIRYFSMTDSVEAVPRFPILISIRSIDER